VEDLGANEGTALYMAQDGPLGYSTPWPLGRYEGHGIEGTVVASGLDVEHGFVEGSAT
jgi:hypothetical protein